MKCHYEVLNVAKDAEEAEIKSAYKKLALKWHPDKNLERPEEAKEQFQFVQQAYEVLSDRQERAWYDNHREQILRGSDKEYEDNSLDVFQYFTTFCFKGYGDDENGFYAVYRKVFEDLAKEDLDHMDDKNEFTQIPHFGGPNSDYDAVVGPFYNHWLSYSTKKSYVWLDPYNINETRQKKIVKLIEKDNKKVRAKAKKERNEEVRNLVAFVRKRDKRVQAHAKRMEQKSKDNKQKQQELSKQKRLERKKELHDNSHTQAEWTKFDNVKSELEEIEKNLAEQFGDECSNSEEANSEDEDLDNLYCVACNKIFKTPRAFENHESSKKHRDNVEKLKQTMLEEEDESKEDDESNEEAELSNEEILISNEEIVISNEEISEDEIIIQEKVKSKKKNKKNKSIVVIESEEEQIVVNVSTNDDVEFETKKQKKKPKKKKEKTPDKDNAISNDPVESGDEMDVVETKKGRKSKRKNERKQDAAEDVDHNHCCAACKSSFSSKNRLFEHLKKTGHSVYLPKAPAEKQLKGKGVREK